MVQTINIFYTEFTTELSERNYSNYLERLPFQLQEKNNKIIPWQNKHAHLFGKLLLQEALMHYNYLADCLENLKYNAFGRPYLNDKIDFNIAHSGAFVMCAISDMVKLGIDIEKIQAIDFKDFKSTMTDEQWQDIKSSINPLQSFFKYWTIKESVIKADGRTFLIPLTDIQIKGKVVNIDNHSWYLEELKFKHNYQGYLAIDNKNYEVKTIKKIFTGAQ